MVEETALLMQVGTVLATVATPSKLLQLSSHFTGRRSLARTSEAVLDDAGIRNQRVEIFATSGMYVNSTYHTLRWNVLRGRTFKF
jgi:hypothetical protein